MGVDQSPDMERALSSIMEEIECNIINIAAFSDDWGRVIKHCSTSY
jgi:hypothetical protein